MKVLEHIDNLKILFKLDTFRRSIWLRFSPAIIVTINNIVSWIIAFFYALYIHICSFKVQKNIIIREFVLKAIKIIQKK